jgi:hypothetical protein
LEKLNEYAESVFQELAKNENFRKGKEHFEKFQRTRIKDCGKYNDYIQDYFIKKIMETKIWITACFIFVEHMFMIY